MKICLSAPLAQGSCVKESYLILKVSKVWQDVQYSSDLPETDFFGSMAGTFLC